MDSWLPPAVPNLRPVTAPIAHEVLPPDGLAVDPSAWWTFAESNADALVVGEDLAAWRVLSAVWPTLPKPRFWCDVRKLKPNLSMYTEGTLILENLDALETSEQQRVLEWSGRRGARSRVIATASPLLVTLVEDGRFSRALYDCLTSAKLVLM